MSKADEIFEQLEFRKVLDTDTDILYRFRKRLMGDLIIHNILFAKVSKLIFSYGTDIDQTCGIGMPELQAINEKVKELRLGINNK